LPASHSVPILPHERKPVISEAERVIVIRAVKLHQSRDPRATPACQAEVDPLERLKAPQAAGADDATGEI